MRILPALAISALLPLAISACSQVKFMRGGAPEFSRADQPCKDASFPIYFDRGSDQLTAEAHALLSAMGERVKVCRVKSAEVVGLADAGGPSERSNVELSKRRADSVARALSDAGLPAPKLEVLGEGSSGAVTAAGRPEPLRRRTEVILHVSPR